MAFPDVTPEVILEAMNKFDREQRNTPAWEKWMEYENFRYALVHNERPYPVKQIVSIATGVDLKDFNSNTARNYLELKGFVIIPLDKLLEQDLKKKRMEYFSINPGKETTPESAPALTNESESNTQTGKTLVERLAGAVGNTATSPDPNINWSKFGTPITTFEEWQKSLGAIKTDFIRQVAQNYPLWLEENYKENIIQAFFMDGGQPNLGVLLNNRLRINCYFNAEKFVFVTLINPTAADLDFLEQQISLEGNFRPRMNLDWLKEGVAFCLDLKNQEDYEVLKGYTSRLIEMEDSKTQSPGFATGAEAGMNGREQQRIALATMVANGGVATIQQIYVALEAKMDGKKLSDQGKASLRNFINTDAVKAGYVSPPDAKNPGWRITQLGRDFLNSLKPVSNENQILQQATEAFADVRSLPIFSMQVKVRRARAAQLREMLAKPEQITVEQFNREVWVYESETLLNGVNIKGDIFDNIKLSATRTAKLEEALENNSLELRGNYIWSSGAGIYGSRMGMAEESNKLRSENIGKALSILNDTDLTPLKKAKLINQILGFGDNSATGLVMVYHPNEFAIYNTQSKEALALLGYKVKTLEEFENSAQKLKEVLGAEDYLEQDWFLYWLNHQQVANEPESLKNLKSLLVEEEDLPLEEPEEELAQEKIDSISLEEWKAYVQANASQELVRKIANDYPDWLQKTFGDTIQIRKFEGVGGKALGVWREEDWIINTYFNNKRNIFIHIKLNEEESEQLHQSLKNPNSLKKRVKLGQFGESLTYSLWLNNYPDYQAIKDILIKMLTPNGSAETESTMIEAAYTVLSEAGGDSMNIKDILAQVQRRGLVDSELTSTELSSAMLRDSKRFMQLNGNTWRINPDFNLEPTVKTKNRIKRLATNILYRATPNSRLQDYYLTDSTFNLKYEPDQNLNIKTGADLLIAGPDGSILPLPCKVIKVDENQNLLTVEPVTHLSRAVTPLEIERITGQSPDFQLLDVSESEYAEIIKAMGNERLTEKALLDYVLQYITHSGYYFDKETLYNYHICLKTRPFVILAGLSGTGKSKLAQLYASALGHNVSNERYLRLAVRPSWNDDRYLLGYLNTLTGEYETEPAVDYLFQAAADQLHLYFMCLDEMNLAHVEYYFSQFLSALEEDKPENRIIPLIGKSALARLTAQNNSSELNIAKAAYIPANLLFTGTINVDETTQMLSDKVIDRANTIEFFEVDLDKIPDPQPLPTQLELSSVVWASYRAQQPDKSYRSQIIEIGKILNLADLGLGYRVLRDIEMYLANSKGLLEPKVAFDLQVKQRILPRVRGSDTETTRKLLEELINFMKKYDLPRSLKRLEEMQRRLKRDGYTGFWR